MIPSLEFYLDMIPPTTVSQQKRLVVVGGKPRFFKSRAMKEAEGGFLSVLLPHQPAQPIAGAVSLEIEIVWPWRASTPKRVRARGWEWHDTKPDLDNWVKQFIDCMVSLRFIEDDAKIAELRVKKRRGDSPGISVGVYSVAGESGFPFEEVTR